MNKLLSLLVCLCVAAQAQITTIRTIAPAATTNLVTANSIQPSAFNLTQFATNGYASVAIKSGVVLTNVALTVPATATATGQVAYINTSGVLDVPNGALGALTAIRSNLAVYSRGEVNGHDQAMLAGGVVFDGVAGAYIKGTSQNVGTNDFSVWLRIRVPNTNPAASQTIWCAGSSGGTASAAHRVWIDTVGTVHHRFYGATSSDWRDNYITSIIATYGGQYIDYIITRAGATLTYYINGVAVTPTADTGGTYPAWSDPMTTTTVFIGSLDGSGTTPYSSGIARSALFNNALTQAEIIEILATGIPQRFKWGTYTALYTADWSAGVDSWSGFSATVANVASVSDGATTKNNVLSITCTGGSADHRALRVDTPSGGKSYRIKGYAYIPSTNLVAVKYKIAGSGGGTTLQSAASASTWTAFDVTFTQSVSSMTSYAIFYLCNSAGTTTLSADTELMYLADLTITAVGCYQDPDLTVGCGYQFHDRSSNKLHVGGSYSSSGPAGWAHKFPKISGKLVKTGLVTTGTSLNPGTGGTYGTLPPNAIITDIIVTRTAGANATTQFFIGTTSSGGQITVPTDLSASFSSVPLPVTMPMHTTTTGRELFAVISSGASWGSGATYTVTILYDIYD